MTDNEKYLREFEKRTQAMYGDILYESGLKNFDADAAMFLHYLLALSHLEQAGLEFRLAAYAEARRVAHAPK